ncbi:MAG TPA: methyltransferase domain-containing protein [Polyangia bacterium]|jgi:SAM-dependent methyltransferase
MQAREHWESVYRSKAADQVSWYRPHLERSLRTIEAAGLNRDAAIIDVGGGASTLVDDLLARGYTNVTVLDVSPQALETAKARLGARAARVRWLVADVTRADLPAAAYDCWHDRAVFHFLREEAERRRYVAAVRRSVKPGGHVLIATFGPDGPSRCSGLDVVRYGADQLHAAFGGEFQKVDSATEIHTTPGGKPQQFVYCHCRLGAPR